MDSIARKLDALPEEIEQPKEQKHRGSDLLDWFLRLMGH